MTLKKLQPCMPPLLQEEKQNGVGNSTSYSGAACENLVLFYLLSKNYNVSEPKVDDGIDVLIQRSNGWDRGQVKKVVYRKYKEVLKSNSEIIYRDRFNFNFQSAEGTGASKRTQKKAGSVDYFYHVLFTPYRQLIWETPASIIPLRENGEYIQTINPSLDRTSWVRKKAKINFNDFLVYKSFHPIIFEKYPEFFNGSKIKVTSFIENEYN